MKNKTLLIGFLATLIYFHLSVAQAHVHTLYMGNDGQIHCRSEGVPVGPLPVPLPGPAPSAPPANASGYLGCYTDSTPRALPLELAHSGQTIESCIALARGQGLAYAGLQYYGQCFGGNKIGFTRVSESECNLPCHGNMSQICGGSWRNSIYPTGIQPVASSVPTPAPTASPVSGTVTHSGTNVAQGKPVVSHKPAAHEIYNSYVQAPARLTDGNQSVGAYPANFSLDYEVDLLSTYSITTARIVVNEYGTMSPNVYITSWQVTGINSSGQSVLLAAGGSPQKSTIDVPVNQSLRKIRFLASSTTNWIGAYELQAFSGAPVATPAPPAGTPVNVALGKPVVSNKPPAHEIYASYVQSPAYLTDGNLSSVAYPANFGVDYEVDLLSNYQIKNARVVVDVYGTTSPNVYITSWQITGINSLGQSVLVGSGGSPQSNAIDIPVNQNLRKIRFIASSTTNWIGAYELQAFYVPPTPAPTPAPTPVPTPSSTPVPVPTITGLTPSVAAPFRAGTAMTWTAKAVGGVGPLQYQFRVHDTAAKVWTTVRAYSTSNTYSWTPTKAGNFGMSVWVRNAGSTAEYTDKGPIIYFDVKPASTPAPTPAPAKEVVLHAGNATAYAGNFAPLSDSTAAGGRRMNQLDAGVAKLTAASASPIHYFELGFYATAGVPYRLWIRGKAKNNAYTNDSVFVQFTNSLDSSGQAMFRIGTTSATMYSVEDSNSAGLSGWGWADNGYGIDGPTIKFATSGLQKIRVQSREDGISIDQIVLSPKKYLTTRPGLTKNDATILPALLGN